ncbi:NAD(P)-dependent oxidoreductase [Nocardioides sp. YJ-D4]
MKIAILGATGNVGSHTLKEAVTAGHEVIAYARRPEAVERLAGVTVVPGELDDTAALTAAITGAETLIISITGPVRDKTFTQRTLPGILTSARESGTGRVVLVSAFGAGDTADKASPFARLLYRTILKGFFDDKAAAEKLLPTSGPTWTVAYPVNLKDAPALDTTTIKAMDQVGKVPGLPTLPFSNAAKALVEIATSDAYANQRVLITTPNGWKPAS